MATANSSHGAESQFEKAGKELNLWKFISQ